MSDLFISNEEIVHSYITVFCAAQKMFEVVKTYRNILTRLTSSPGGGLESSQIKKAVQEKTNKMYEIEKELSLLLSKLDDPIQNLMKNIESLDNETIKL